MFEAYKQAVLTAYQSLKANRQLSSELESPSPGKLRAICEQILAKNPEKRDYETLKDFFNPKNEYDSLEKSISRYELDKLKPLVNLMKGEIMDSNDRNFKLLAVLINFEPRPYKDIGITPPPPPLGPLLPVESGDGAKPEKTGGGGNDNGGNNIGSTGLRPRWKTATLYVIAVIAISLLSYFLFGTIHRGCMIWRVDRYLPISCKENVGDSMMVAMDRYKLKNFQKIMKQDTVTEHSIGKFWYLKTNNKLELFTTGGKHPVHTERQLKILTDEIFYKYLSKEDH